MVDARPRQLRSRRHLSNVAVTIIDPIVSPVLFFLSMPILLSSLGETGFGLWLLINATVGVSGLLSFGVSDANIKYVATYVGAGRFKDAIRVHRTTAALYSLVALFSAGLVFTAAPVIATFLSSPNDPVDVVAAALRAGALCIAIRFIDGIFASSLIGFHLFTPNAIVTALVNFLTLITCLIMAVNGYDVCSLVYATAAVIALGAAAKAGALLRGVRSVSVLIPVLDMVVVREVLGFAVQSWLQNVGGTVLSQLDRLLVGSVAGIEAVGYYGVCVQATQQIHGILVRGAQVFFTEACAISYSGDRTVMRRWVDQGAMWVSTGAVAMSVPLFLCAHDVLHIWMGAEFADRSAPLLRYLAASAGGAALTIIPFYVLNATGHAMANTIIGLCSGSVICLFGYLLMLHLGPVGMAIAKAGVFIGALIQVTYLQRRVLGETPTFLSVAAWFLPVLAPFCLVAVAVQSDSITTSGLGGAEIIAVGSVASILGAIMAAGLSWLRVWAPSTFRL